MKQERCNLQTKTHTVAALYDIHGNLPALQAVLQDVRDSAVDCVVVGGDVFPGPMPRETLACLLDLRLPIYFIRGNGDREVLAQMQGLEIKVPEHYRDAMRWIAEQLYPDYEKIIASWPEAIRLEVAEVGEVFFCHATPRNDSDIFTRLTPEEQLLTVFRDTKEPTVVCGHTHMQFERQIGGTRVVNAGSVGMPFGKPGAYWLQIGPAIQLRRTDLDLNKAAEEILRSSYPLREEFARDNILQPPSEQKMLDLFAKVAVR